MNQIEQYKEFLKQDPNNEILIISLSELLHKNGNFEEALITIDRILSAEPKHEIALSRKASILISYGRANEAYQILDQLVQLNSDSEELAHNLAVAGFYKKNIENAILDFEKLIKIEKLEASSNKYLAACYYSKNEFDKSLNYIQKAIDLDPNDYLEGFKSVIQYTSGNVDDGVKTAKTVLKTSPENLDALSVIGTRCIEKFEINTAIKKFQKMRAINQYDSRAYNGLGLCYLQQKLNQEAIVNFKKAIELAPTNLGYIAVLGWAYISNYNIEKAVETFEKALSIESNFAEGHGALATAYLFSSNIGKAEEHCSLAFKLDKQCFSAIYCQSILLSLKGKDDIAKSMLTKTLDQPLRPGEPSIAELIQKHALTQPPVSTNQPRLN